MELHPIIPRKQMVWSGHWIIRPNEWTIHPSMDKSWKKLIRENKRKQIKEQQHPIINYFPWLTSTTQSPTPPVSNQSTKARNQPSINNNTIQINMDECSMTTALKSPQQHLNTSSIATISRLLFIGFKSYV